MLTLNEDIVVILHSYAIIRHISFKIFFRQYGKEMTKLAVDQVRDEFKQMAIEGGLSSVNALFY
jgi:hypothetical protein